MTAPRLVELGGDRRRLGLEHGEALRYEIHASIEIYRAVFARPDDQICVLAGAYRAAIESYAPGAVTEMDGIAVGAGCEPWWIVALNARSEIMNTAAPDGCTSVFAPRALVLGQTWDWMSLFEDLVTVLRVAPDDADEYVTLTEPGIIAKIGMNAAGLGVCLNYFDSSITTIGVPIHVVLAELHRAPSLDAARSLITRAGGGRAGHVLIGSDSGAGVAVQFLGDRSVVTELDDVYVHASHVEGEPLTGGRWADNSEARLRRAKHLAASVDDVDSLHRLLSDDTDPHAPICAPYVPFAGVELGTVATVTMELDRRAVHVGIGPSRRAEITVTLDAEMTGGSAAPQLEVPLP
jgi:isopenicillin-N N-acyltransferase like protein